MTPAAAARAASPCVNVCRMQADSGLCEGCLRTIDEIAAWGQLDDAARRAVWLQIDERRAQRALNVHVSPAPQPS